ncbi:MAG TPA: BatA domain-containing protein, partial [Candidatus Binataceae bacterium]|nr:BatA domain-containing protein [Candidatus Binataceae bacterium]
MGFLNPLNLLFGFSIVALVLIYLRSRSRPTIDVSSLILFDETPAPAAKSRVLRVDWLFLLELLALAAMTMAVAGFYVRGTRPVGTHRNRALVFDVGAGMGAIDNGVSRLDQAKQEALRIVSNAGPGDEFSVIAYAVDSRTVRARTTRIADLREAIQSLRPLAVATRPAALRAALIDARADAAIDLFSDRAPSKSVIEDARLDAHVRTHLFAAPADNLSIVSIDPGLPRATPGRCVVRNFSLRPQTCNL